MKKQRSVFALAISMLHACFMIGLTLLYMSLHLSLEDEIILVKLSSSVRNLLAKKSIKFDKDRFLFVNVAWQKKLIPKLDSAGIPIGVIDITDRAALATLLERMSQKPDNHEFLFVDINLEIPSSDDSLLQAAFNKTKNYLVSYHKNQADKPIYPILEVNTGLSDMQTEIGEMVLKYHIVQGDSLKTSPLIMYEHLHDQQLKKGLIFDKLNGEYIIQNFILDFPISTFNKNELAYTHLSDLLVLPSFAIHEITKDKIVVLGDFEDYDLHETIYGMMPGPFILINAFLALEHKANALSFGFLLWLFITYTFISFKVFKSDDPLTDLVKRKFSEDSFLISLLVDTLFYLVYFGIVSLVAYFLFNVHLAILILSFYMYGLEVVVILIQERQKKKALKNMNNKA